MPLFDFECEECGERFEELARPSRRAPCPACGSTETHRLYSRIAGSQRWHVDRRFAAESNARRTEREARRRERFTEERKRSAAEGA